MWQVELRRFAPHVAFASVNGPETIPRQDTSFVDREFLELDRQLSRQFTAATPFTTAASITAAPVAAARRDAGPPCDTQGKLWVVCAYFNPCNYENRRINYEIFADHLLQQGVPLCTVEMASSESALRLQQTADRYGMYVPVISQDVLWAKEALINIGARRLPDACTVIVWADADLVWEERDWAVKTLRELERPNGPVVVQPFDHAVNMKQDERYETHYAQRDKDSGSALPIGKAYVNRPETYVITADIYKLHAGYAWAMRRDVFNQIGGLYVYCICGQADFVMAIAFSHDNKRDGIMPVRWNPDATFSWGYGLQSHARQWQTAVAAVVSGRLGYVKDVHIFHNWHGDPHDRQYNSRGRALVDYDPAADIVRLPSGALAWTPAARVKQLPEKLKAYFENRKEDGRPAHEVAARDAHLARMRSAMKQRRF
jgi:hypothetical protein